MTPTSEELQRLLERVEGATEGSRDLDGHVRVALGLSSVPVSMMYPAGRFYAVEEFSTSLDAAVALVEKKLPRDWTVGFQWGQTGTLADAWITYKFSEHSSEAQGRTPALAILAALLRALIQKENGG